MRGFVMTQEELLREATGSFTDKQNRTIHASTFGITNCNELIAIYSEDSQQYFTKLTHTNGKFVEKDTIKLPVSDNSQKLFQQYNNMVSEDDCVSGTFEVPNFDVLCIEGHYYSVSLDESVLGKLHKHQLYPKELTGILGKVLKIGKVNPSYPKRTKYAIRDRGNVVYIVTAMLDRGLVAVSCSLIGNGNLDNRIESLGLD